MNLTKYIKLIPDFPKKGIMFKDITPLLNDKDAYHYVIEQFIAYAKEVKADVIVAPEARGFLFGPSVSYGANLRFIPVRKPNRLPREVRSEAYDLEYGKNVLEVHKGDIKPKDRVLIIDDVLATGGTVEAICKLVEAEQAEVVGMGFLIVIHQLQAAEKLAKYNMKWLIEY